MQIKTPLVMLAIAAIPGEANTIVDEPRPERPPETIIDLRSLSVSGPTVRDTPDRLPGISIWTNREDIARRGQRVRVFFEATEDTYVTVFRIDTDGRVSVLFPLGPWDHGFARGGRRYEVRPHADRYAFTANDLPGEGYVFAAASVVPFNYTALSVGARWHYRDVGYDGRIVGDPYVAVMDLIDLVAPLEAIYPTYDIVPYYVDRRVDYPRFSCYECHTYLRGAAWDPYRDPCREFRLVVYDDPAYYPVRARNGARVVFTRSNRLEPRFVFTQRIGSEPDIEVRHRRPENRMERRTGPDRLDRRARRKPQNTRPTPSVAPRRLNPQPPARRGAPGRVQTRRRVRPPDTSGIRVRRRSG